MNIKYTYIFIGYQHTIFSLQMNYGLRLRMTFKEWHCYAVIDWRRKPPNYPYM